METTNFEKQTHWESRLHEWKSRVMEQQRFHESVSSYLKRVYDKSKKTPEECMMPKN